MGGTMRRAIVLCALLGLAATEGRCAAPLDGGGGRYDPCAGRACGEACTACPPSDRGCGETAVVKACDAFGQCVPAVEGSCTATNGPCAFTRCGGSCVIEQPCRHATPPCLGPDLLGLCDRNGACVPGPAGPGFCAPPLPEWGCRGQGCGDPCGYCPPGADWATCPVPTFAATACDGLLRCVTSGTFTCGP